MFDYQEYVNAADGIHIHDSKMGYFQFVVFNLIGTNYCNYWHSNYSELSIISSQAQLVELTELEDDFYYKFSTVKQEAILKIQPSPVIETFEDSTTVSLVLLSPWKGFTEYTYSVTKNWPHQQKIIVVDRLLEYNCGILF